MEEIDDLLINSFDKLLLSRASIKLKTLETETDWLDDTFTSKDNEATMSVAINISYDVHDL